MKSKDQTTYIKLSIVSHGEKANQKNQISKNFPWTQSLCTKRVFSWLSKTSQGPNHFELKGYFLDCSPAWLISVFQSQTGNTHLLAEKCAFAKILLQLFSCLCQPYCSWIYYQPFKNHSRYCVHTWTGLSRISIDCFWKVSLSQLLLLKVKCRLLQYLDKNQGPNL